MGPLSKGMDSLPSHHASEHCTRLMSLWQTRFKFYFFFLLFFIYLFYILNTSFIPCKKFKSLYLGRASAWQPPERRYPWTCVADTGPWRYPCLPVCVAFSCVLTKHDCQDLDLLMCTQVLMRTIAHGGCTDTIMESALKKSTVKSVPCRTGE